MRATKRPVMVRGCLERTVLESLPKSAAVCMEDLMHGEEILWPPCNLFLLFYGNRLCPYMALACLCVENKNSPKMRGCP
ncbi:hypothetical protein PVL29_019423 [Vitis rotundifolia]|uniref:Uncharacterized protein n=1 Tax=Vitis rotundifolia TaxID=103349 RepID=A0AA38Z0I4_VITRO|nr:hypothetical protein PVL29_019423 [Vitis rotundifolia]